MKMSTNPVIEPRNILLVEDNPDHAELVRICFKGVSIPHRIIHVLDGVLALDYLLRRGDYSDPKNHPLPDIILLDLRLPRIDGLEVLQTIKGHKDLRNIPVVILTTSESQMDIHKAYKLFVNGYLVKPVDYEKFAKMIEHFANYWLVWNRVPTSDPLWVE
jgi:two-component system, response regulator